MGQAGVNCRKDRTKEEEILALLFALFQPREGPSQVSDTGESMATLNLLPSPLWASG
jgi:hypothetical protein